MVAILKPRGHRAYTRVLADKKIVQAVLAVVMTFSGCPNRQRSAEMRQKNGWLDQRRMAMRISRNRRPDDCKTKLCKDKLLSVM